MANTGVQMADAGVQTANAGLKKLEYGATFMCLVMGNLACSHASGLLPCCLS